MKKRLHDLYLDQQTGFAIMQRERDRRIRETNTVQALISMRSAFRMAVQGQPPRPTSGLKEYYEALKRV